MSLDNVKVIDYVPNKAKRDEKLSSNSIRFRLESLAKTRNHAYKQLKEAVNESVESGFSDDKVISNTINYAEYVVQLQNTIEVLAGVSEPIELVSNRAIRLINKMIKAARENSKGIYSVIDKKNSSDKLETTEIDVQKIAEDNKDIANNIEDAITVENTISGEDIDAVFKEALTQTEESEKEKDSIRSEVSTPPSSGMFDDRSEEKQEEKFDREMIEREINKKIEEYVNANNIAEEKDNESEYISMSAEDIEKSREKIGYYESENAQDKGTDVVRDDIVVAPDTLSASSRELKEFTMIEPVNAVSDMFKSRTTVVKPIVDDVKPRKMVVSSEDKEKLIEHSVDDLLELRNSKKKANKSKEEAMSEALRIKEKSERKNASLQADLDEAERRLKLNIIRDIDSYDDSNNALDSDIETTRAATADIDRDSASIAEKIAKYAEIAEMLGNTESTIDYTEERVASVK